MYCVFHHISSHLPRQIWFWKISTKTWASVRPPPPLVGPKAQVFPKINFDGTPKSKAIRGKKEVNDQRVHENRAQQLLRRLTTDLNGSKPYNFHSVHFLIRQSYKKLITQCSAFHQSVFNFKQKPKPFDDAIAICRTH